MKAFVSDGRASPRLVEFREPASDGRSTVFDIHAAALTNLDVAIATGRHYFSPPRGVDVVIGREAVVTSPEGERFFLTAKAIASPFGSMAERTLGDPDFALPVPDGLPDSLAAAIGNAGLAAWLPLSWRARLVKGETVLVLGATGVTGQIAVAAAKILGAERVIAAGRNMTMREHILASGADAVVQLGDDDLTRNYERAAEGRIDVVLDYLNGPPAVAALDAMADGGRMVQIGSPVAPGIMLPAQTMRRASLDVLGFAYYHAPIEEQRPAYEALCLSVLNGKIAMEHRSLPLGRFLEAWSAERLGGAVRQVLLPRETR